MFTDPESADPESADPESADPESADPESADPEPAGLLRRASLRVTAQRLAVLREVRRHPHADVDAIVAGVRNRIGKVSTQAVYDVLHALTDAGLIRRVQPARSPALYEARTGDNHHHVVCRGCGAIGDVDCAVGASPCLSPSDADGFLIEEAEVTYWGICPACQSSTSA